MKKKVMTCNRIVSIVLIIVMLASLSMPALAADRGVNGAEFTGIPTGYTYIGYGKYDADWRVDSAEFVGGVLSTVTLALINPALSILGNVVLDVSAGAVGSKLMGWLMSAQEGEKLYGYYYDYVYECDDPGIYPYIYFHHLKYYTSNNVLLKEEGRYEFALLPRSS